MSKLKGIEPKSIIPNKPKVLIYGRAGVKKTWTSLDFPLAYYCDTEGGAKESAYRDKLKAAGGMYFGVEQGSLNFSSLIEEIKTLATEKHPYKTLVIDSISKVFNEVIAKEADKLGDKDAFGASKKPAIAYMRQLVSWLMRLDMSVILISHEKPEWGMVNGQRAEVGSTFDCWDKLSYELDLCLNIVYAGDKSIARIKKSRLAGFPNASSFPWTYDEFASRYGREIIEKDSTNLVLATPEQLIEIDSVLKKAILPKDYLEKCFAKANVTEFKDMDSDKIQAIINQINKQFLPIGD